MTKHHAPKDFEPPCLPEQLYTREELAALELRGTAEGQALIGDDVQKGLVEVRRLKALALSAYDRERAAQHRRGSEISQAEAAADEAGRHYHYALMHVWRLPIRSLGDVAAKSQFALEECDYTTDEDLKSDVLKQVVAFLAPPSISTAP